MNTLSKIKLLCAAFVTVSALAVTTGASAQSAPLKKVTIAAGVQKLDSSYPWLLLPQALGYWKQEGYDVTVVPTGNSLQSIQQMVGGNAEFAQVNSSAVVQVNAANGIPARVLMANGIIDWQVIVPESSGIKSIADLKGKKIGVPSLGSGGVLLLRAYLRNNGVDPDRDVNLISLGIGAPALDALRTDKVQAAMFWRGMVVIFENTGDKFRTFRDPSWDTAVDFTFTALQSTIDKDPKMVEAIVRGANKATVFAMANPSCVQQITWKNWPGSKPTGADDATVTRWDMNNLNAQLDTMRAANQAFGGGKLWGRPTLVSYASMQDMLHDAQVIPKKIDASSLLLKDTGFYARVNDFDQASVVAQAKACKI